LEASSLQPLDLQWQAFKGLFDGLKGRIKGDMELWGDKAGLKVQDQGH
jgi:hypothetical protein